MSAWPFNLPNSEQIEIAKIFVSVLGFAGTIAALLFGLRQYKRSEQWKRGEFIAKEIKEFEADPRVHNAMLMIDWGKRPINLHLKENPSSTDYVQITRDIQWKALVPHPLKEKYKSDSPLSGQSTINPNFTNDEMAIRDTYDVFFRYLERFVGFNELVSANEFKPFLSFWIESMAKSDRDEDAKVDAKWRCALFTYINFYKYLKVKSLFEKYGYNVDCEGELYKKQGELMDEKELYQRLSASIQSERSIISDAVEGSSTSVQSGV